jgi:trehalose/maltose hydrolase-like predicted phosphorylase
MFPWESAFTGAEVQYGGGKIGPWGEYEQHISGDIALAARQYWYTTGDKRWLEEVGFPLANGTAAFYAARIQPKSSNSTGRTRSSHSLYPGRTASASTSTSTADDHYHQRQQQKAEEDQQQEWDYNMVMGPDEYAYPVNNSAYTNAVASIAMSFAAEAASVLGYSGPAYADYVTKSRGLKILIDQDVPTRPDLKGGYHPEYQGFPKEKNNPKVKQADTIMLSYPLGVAMSPDVLSNDLTFYDPITDRSGPAMTWAIFAIGWMAVGNFTQSQGHFRQGYANVQSPFNVWTETPHGGTVNFITGAGGFLQSVIFGTSGMRITSHALTFNPPPPSSTGTGATMLGVRSLHYLGNRLSQQVTQNSSVYELLESGATCLEIFAEASQPSSKPMMIGVRYSFRREKVVIQPAS